MLEVCHIVLEEDDHKLYRFLGDFMVPNGALKGLVFYPFVEILYKELNITVLEKGD